MILIGQKNKRIFAADDISMHFNMDMERRA